MTEEQPNQVIEQEVTEEKSKAESQKQEQDDNVIFIGQKPFMNYVTAVVTQFNTKQNKEVIIKARGKFISRAVDVAEVAGKRFLKDDNIQVKDIRIDSEEFENKEGKRINVSTIEILLKKP